MHKVIKSRLSRLKNILLYLTSIKMNFFFSKSNVLIKELWFLIFHFFVISAPSGCLQYYTSASGQFKSFNYRTEPAADDGPNHLANLNYAICFRIENGFCGIKYSQVSSDLFSFTLSGDASTITALGIIKVFGIIILKISTLQPQYNKPRNSEFLDIVNKTQLPF